MGNACRYTTPRLVFYLLSHAGAAHLKQTTSMVSVDYRRRLGGSVCAAKAALKTSVFWLYIYTAHCKWYSKHVAACAICPFYTVQHV